MSKSRPKKPPDTTRPSHRNRKTWTTRSAARSKNIEGRTVSFVSPETSAALSLLNAGAVRERAHRMLAIGLEDKLPNFSIFLDAGAGPTWRYQDPKTELAIGRSEGLGLASLAMFAGGVFSANPQAPLRADASVLAKLGVADLQNNLQVSPTNPLVGIDGRADLLRCLGALVASKPEIFGSHDTPRPGGLFDRFVALANDGRLPAPTIMSELLQQFGPIWPSRLTLGGIALGDCWKHPSLVTADVTNGLVPLHKLSQWLAYSLIEPLQTAGITVTDIDGLTGLAEYRNGGLFIDIGVLTFRDADAAQREHDVASSMVVEWRALTG